MSRIGNKHIVIPTGVDVKVEGSTVTVKGGKGSLTKTFSPLIGIEVKDGQLIATRSNEEKTTKQLHGTTRALLQGMVIGVNEGFKKTLSITGIGYKAALQGDNLVLNIGYSHQVIIKPLPNTKITVVTPTEVDVTGIDKEMVGQLAALIREVRPPEPYLGKGIAYKGEKIRRKEGKKAGKK